MYYLMYYLILLCFIVVSLFFCFSDLSDLFGDQAAHLCGACRLAVRLRDVRGAPALFQNILDCLLDGIGLCGQS